MIEPAIVIRRRFRRGCAESPRCTGPRDRGDTLLQRECRKGSQERPICGVSARPRWLWHVSPARSTTEVLGSRTEVGVGRSSLPNTMQKTPHSAGCAPARPWHALCLSIGMKEHQTVREFLASVSVGEPLSFERLALYPCGGRRSMAAPSRCCWWSARASSRCP